MRPRQSLLVWGARVAVVALLASAIEIALLLSLVPVAGSSALGLLHLAHVLFASYGAMLLPVALVGWWLERRGALERHASPLIGAGPRSPTPRPVGVAAILTVLVAIAAAQTLSWQLLRLGDDYPEFPERIALVLHASLAFGLVVIALVARYAVFPAFAALSARVPRLDRPRALLVIALLAACPGALVVAYLGLAPVLLDAMAAVAAAAGASCALAGLALARPHISARQAAGTSVALLALCALAPLSCRHAHARFLLYNHCAAGGTLAEIARDVGDRDGDGSPSTWLGGSDCDDGDAERGPERRERAGDGIDQDCRGGDAVIEPASTRVVAGLDCRATTEPLSLLLITLDAVGAQSLGPELTPSLTLFATESLEFTRAYSPSTSTVESLASLFAGRSLSALTDRTHGIALPSDLLAARLAARGHRALAVDALELPAPLRSGFAPWSPWWLDSVAQSGKQQFQSAATSNAALDLLARVEHPLFLWVHYVDAHAPYLELDYRGGDVSPHEREIAYVDMHVGRLFAGLARLPAAGRTVVVVTADHGEELARRGVEGHGPLLYESSVRVPLMVRIPGCGPQRIDAPVSLSDLAPSLARLVSGDGAPGPRAEQQSEPVAVTEAISGSSFARSIVTERFKLIVDVRNGGRLLFDLASDPAEANDVYDAAPADAARMEAVYQAWLDRAQP